MHEKVKYKLSRCFVPSCKNRPSAAGKSKLFFPVPKGEERNEWIRSCGRKSTSLVTTHIICEDHFTLEDDVTGYHSFVTAVRLGCPPPCKSKLKKGILPTKFGQDEANLSSNTISLTASSIKTETSPSNFQDPSPYNDAFPSPLADALDHRLNPEIESPSSLMNISPFQLTSSNNVMSGLSFESCNEIYPTNEATPSSHTSTETHYFTPSNTTGHHSEKRNTPVERDKPLRTE
ncbi:unnamed protein product [Bemisia tabaci]|uniref:THAP-type domain-containing protein n=1 Tax=Bemisia tabaci TaxID=7038 RepID=A0A9N9ZZA1_BEMTA|nr:unnamed protein product [Bemisia tabaci]